MTSPGLGIVFLVVAPAGAGKSSLMKRVMARVPGLSQLPTATTRPIRENEQNGREHLFVTSEEFQRMIADHELLEHQIIHGRFYGMPRSLVEGAMREGRDIIADIDYKGALYARDQYPSNVILIFIQPPSIETLIERMGKRGEPETEIARRLARVPGELSAAASCDYLILNDDLDEAADVLYAIVTAERSRRDVLKLRLEQQEPSWTAAMYITQNGTILIRNGEPFIPSARIQPGEAPHQAALRALSEQLSISTSVEQFVFDELMPDGSIPPVSASYQRQGNREQVTLYYLYQLEAMMKLSAEWAWMPPNELTLPQPILEALAGQPT